MSEPQYDAIGDTFVKGKTAFFESERDHAREFILAHLTDVQGKFVLDIGCGAGDDIVVYEQMPFAEVYGVDPSTVMIQKAKAVSAYPERVSVGDFEATGRPNESIDYAVSRFALHYLDTFEKAYEEVARLLKPGGLLVFAVDHPTADRVEGERFMVGSREYVRIKLYNGSVVVEFPLHDFSDYFSPTFLKHFELLKIAEPIGTDREYQAGPNALLFAARKK